MRYYEVTFSVGVPDCQRTDACDLLAAMCGELGFEAFEETADGLKGYVETGLFDEDALRGMLDDFPFEGAAISYNVCEAEYKDWNEQWEAEGFDPIVVGECCIHDGRHLPEGNFRVSVEIDARLAFGTGSHETTRMMVSVLNEFGIEGKDVLDCGCGTGILAIVALKLGASHAFGFDIDEWSVENARHNATINGIGGNLEVAQGDAAVVVGHEGGFDVVLANINRNVLLDSMPRFRDAMREGGMLALSGFYTADIDIVEKRANEFGLGLVARKEENGWACLVFKLR